MKAGETIVRAKGLRLGYGRESILDGVDLEIRSGEFWFLVGPNGSGKTTLLRGILGEIEPRAGEIYLHPRATHPEKLGFVPQRCDLSPSLPTTVKEFVLLGTVGLRMAGGAQAERLSWALDQVGLAGLARADYRSLSGGQRQRALVARALVRRPEFLVVDEPTSGLDLSVADALLRSLSDLNRREDLTLIFVTHDISIAARYGSHVALFHGRRIDAGPAGEILSRDNLRQTYGVSVEIWKPDDDSVSVRIGGAAEDK